MRYVAAFRTYTWDDDVRELARRFFAACPNACKVVLADETRGSLGITEYEVISHTSDTSARGLPNYPPESSLWYNVDYGVYILRDSLPGYPYYLLSESDLAVNLPLEPMVATAAERELDFVAHQVGLPPPEWCWKANGEAHFDQVWQALLFFMLLSDRAIEILLRRRQAQGVEFANGLCTEWPYCESFVPSVLKEAGMRFGEISEFADTFQLRYRPRVALDDPVANGEGSLVHSVLGTETFIDTVIRENRPRDALFPQSELARALHRYPLSAYSGRLKTALHAASDHAGITRLSQLLTDKRTKMDGHDKRDLAYCKPALSSSTSKWSHHPDPQLDAAGANGPELQADRGFHTSEEDGPWWIVDLTVEAVIDEIQIVNRPGFTQRFVNFFIEGSMDGAGWTIHYVKMDAAEVSADADVPFRIRLNPPFVARFVRIRLIGFGMLHLRRVSIFGRELPPPADF